MMTVDQDPTNEVNNEGDEFNSAFEEFAAARAGTDPAAAPDPKAEEQSASEGNGPGGEAEPETGAQAPAGEQTPAESVTSDQSPAGAEAPAEQQPANDPWANAPPELIAERERLQAERDRALHKARSDANRVAALSRKLEALSHSPAETQPNEAQKALDEKLDKLVEEFPTVGGPIKEAFAAQRDQLGRLEQAVNAQTIDQITATAQREAEALSEAHPDWQVIATDPSWAQWVGSQSPGVQAIAQSSSAAEVSVAINLYKMERVAAATRGQPQTTTTVVETQQAPATTTDAKRARQLDGGADVRSKTPAAAATGAPDEFDAAFAHFAALRDQKRR